MLIALTTAAALLTTAPGGVGTLGFADVAFVGDTAVIASADGTLRGLSGDEVSVAVTTGRPMLGISATADGRRVAAVGAGVLARSDDGGRIFGVEPLPDDATAHAVAWSGGALLVFDQRGRGFRSLRSGHFEPLPLPKPARWWSAAASGPLVYVVGDGALVGSADGGRTWRSLPVPTPQPQGVLVVGSTVWVSGRGGVFRSLDRGERFEQVLTLNDPRDACMRMAVRTGHVAVACAPRGQALFVSADGRRFTAVAAPEAGNLLAVAISSSGGLVAVGAFELILRSDDARSGTLLYHSAESRRWQQLVARNTAPGHAGPARAGGALDSQQLVARGSPVARAGRASADPGVSPEAQPQTAATGGGRDLGSAEEAAGARAGTGLGLGSAEEAAGARAGLGLGSPEEAAPLRGTLCDPSGRPVAGADVWLSSADPTAGPRRRSRTDAQGRFELPPPIPRSGWLRVDVAGWAPLHHVFSLPDPRGAEQLDLRLQRPVGLAGRITTDDGAPAVASMRLLPLPPPPLAGPRWLEVAAPIALAVADGGGGFRFTGVAPGSYLLHAAPRGLPAFTRVVTAPGPSVELAARRGGALTGWFVDPEGRPLSGATVQLRGGPPLRTTVDEAGRFQLFGVPDGEYSLALSAAAPRACLSRTVALTGGRAPDLLLRLGQGPTLRGRVVDRQGSPVPFARVIATTAHDPQCGSRAADADERGEFVLTDVTDAPYSVSAVAAGAVMKSGTTFARTEGRAGQHIDVVIDR